MPITTSSFYQKNIDLFQSLDRAINDIQVQVSTGSKTMSLDKDLQDISRLNATEEHRAEVSKFKGNAEIIISDLTRIDGSFEQLQNASVRLKELHIESSNGFLTDEERKLFKHEIAAIKTEILSVANRRDALGNGFFSGTSTEGKPFKADNLGIVSYSGSAAVKNLEVSRENSLRQNFSGSEVFLSAGKPGEEFSVFEALDEFSRSLDYNIGAEQSSNILSGGASADLIFPPSGKASNYKFELVVDGVSYKVDANAYADDLGEIVSQVNGFTGSTGVTATVVAGNKLRLSGVGVDVKISNYSTDLPVGADQEITITKAGGNETLLPKSLSNFQTQEKIHQIFEHFIAMRSELSIASRAAQNTVSSAQETLVNLNEEVASLEDADMAALLTQLQDLLNNKDAAQATFSRITSKSLFDFMG